MEKVVQRLCEELALRKSQVENTINLIDQGNTIPFIARYRKEVTGSLGDEVLRELAERLEYLRNLEHRKEEVIRLIDQQEKLTPELDKKIKGSETLQEVEDIYRPFRPKRRTRATVAREKGLEPLAGILIAQQLMEGDIEKVALDYVDPEKEINTPQEALQGAMDIIAEIISDDADLRKVIRQIKIKKGKLVVKGTKEEVSDYNIYYDFKEG